MAARLLGQPIGHLLQGHAAGIAHLAARRGKTRHGLVHQRTGKQHRARLRQQALAFEGDEFRIARPRADEPDFAARARRSRGDVHSKNSCQSLFMSGP